MNKTNLKLLSLVLTALMLLSALTACPFDMGGNGSTSSHSTTGTGYNTSSTEEAGDYCPIDDHSDIDNNGLCDDCGYDVVETIDFYNFNDLHGKFSETAESYGVGKLTAYLEERMEIDEHVVLFSTGDMWQGGAESNTTKGAIITDWMNYLGFEAMALGNHEFDWGEEHIEKNAELADFPLLAINVYDVETGERVEYCDASVMIERGGAKIGVIGAIGNCYDDIAASMTKGVKFKVGSELTALVRAESERLREAGADMVVYLIHDGASGSIGSYYDQSLSRDGCVDLVFEGHSHQYYVTVDAYGVPHLQGGGDNKRGMTHVEVDVNFANGEIVIFEKELISHYAVNDFDESPIVEELTKKYWDELKELFDVLGYNSSYRSSTTIGNTVAKLYYEAGVERWGDEYDIVLAGGSLKTRSPYDLQVGDVRYSDLQMLLTFDNPLYLCSVKGSTLVDKFLNNSSYRKYSTISASQVDRNATYYIMADSWTALYAWAECTPIELYDENIFARDLLAEFIKNGGWE